MKKIFLCFLAVLLLASALSGCGNKKGTDKFKVVTTVFPVYDWVSRIAGTGTDSPADITLLLDGATDMHSFAPTVSDIQKISLCDVFIYIGGESDAWVTAALSQAKNKDMVVINLIEALGSAAKIEEEIEEGEHGHDHDHDHEHDHDEPVYDEHVWLSILNAKKLVNFISEKIAAADKDNAALYAENTEKYILELASLEGEYSSALADSVRKTLIFADRFPFRYLAEDYGLECFAAFSGCSTETEASAKTIAFLVDKANETGVPYLVIIDGGNRKIAEKVNEESQNKSRGILVLHSLQSVTKKDRAAGTTYLSVMEKNLEVLKQALN